MNFAKKFISVAALAVVGSALAHAEGYGAAYGYASTNAYEYSGESIYFTGSTGPSLGSYYEGGFGVEGGYSTFGGNGYYYSADGLTNVYSYGAGETLPVAGGSFEEGEVEGSSSATFTNEGSSDATLFFVVNTGAEGLGYASSYEDGGEGEADAAAYDSNETFYQESFALAEQAGLGYFNGIEGYSYDTYQGYSNYVYQSEPFTEQYLGEFDTQTYYLTLAPGQSDTVYVNVDQVHAATSETPGPVAVAPFAIGLVGALRRRKKA